jgi:hypothetical protein
MNGERRKDEGINPKTKYQSHVGKMEARKHRSKRANT